MMDFYYETIYPDLVELEKERKKVLLKVAGSVVAAFAVQIVLMQLMGRAMWEKYQGLVFIVLAFLVFFYVGKEYLFYKTRFKWEVIRRMVLKLDPSLKYEMGGKVDEAYFRMSGLFRNDFDDYGGSDYIEGVIDGVPIRFSNVVVTRERTDTRGNTHRYVVFAGTFIVTEFHKHFRKSVKLYPDAAEKYLGWLGAWLQELGEEKLVRMDSPAFEKHFKVVADDPVEAHYLLTPNIMERIVELRERADAPVFLSFTHDKLFIAIADGGHRFEPSLFRSLLRFELFKNTLESLRLILGLVEELNLNRKIWTKE